MKIIQLTCCLLFAFLARGQEVKLMLPVGHTNSVKSAVFSPDGKKVLTASWDNTAKIWDAVTGQLLISLSGHKYAVHSAVFSRDGRKVLTASVDATAKIWDANTGQLLTTLAWHTRPVSSAEFSFDGKRVVTVSEEGTARLWDTNTGQLLATLIGHTGFITCASFSPDSKQVLTASWDKTARLWDGSTGQLLATLTGHTGYVFSAQFSPNSMWVLTASDDETAKLWDAHTGQLVNTLTGHTGGIISGEFSPDGKQVLTASYDKTGKVWDARTGQLQITLTGHINDVTSAAFSPDSKRIVTSSYDNTAKVWDARTGKLLATLIGCRPMVKSAVFSPDGKLVLTASLDNTARIWNAVTGELRVILTGHTFYVNFAKFSLDGKEILTASSDTTARVWDASTGQLIATLAGHTYGLTSARFSPDKKRILTASEDSSVKLWDVGTGQLLTILNTHTNLNIANAVKFSPNGKQILAVSEDTIVKVWDAVTGQLLYALRGHTSSVFSAEFSPDGKQVLTASNDKTARLWDGGNGQLLITLNGHASGIASARFSPDGKRIITASKDLTAKLWSVVTGQLLATLNGHTGEVNSAEFSPDGMRAFTSSTDATAKIWDAGSGQLLATLAGPTGWFYSSIFSPSGKQLLTTSLTSLTTPFDHVIKLWDAGTGQLVTTFTGYAGYAGYSILFSPDGKTLTESSDNTMKLLDASTGRLLQSFNLGLNTYLANINFNTNRFTAINNSELKFFNLTTGEHLFSFFAIDSTDWAVIHPSGLFDASPAAMEKMYWVKGDEIIDFNQLKDRYWQPGLWEKTMQGKQLRSVEGMGTLKLQPEIELGEFRNNILSIQLKKREGGYGKVSILVNNKEVIADARPKGFDTTRQQLTITINLKEYLVDGIENEISVKTQTADGFLSSRGVSLKHSGLPKTVTKKPAFYAIICGTGEYSNPAIGLKYAVPDAIAIARALTVGANNLFGKDSTHVYLLSSPGNNPTTKKNIQQAFADVKKHAKPADIVMVYLSGHGMTYGGDNGDFYYLTTEASGSSAESFTDPALRQAQSINTAEFTLWLNDIPALKQIMIIDACGSGKVVDNLIAKRDVDASQIKAIDRMKDRTGLYIISGCAADAVSYEASRYGQGLLTYSLLQAMKGAALKENVNVDVLTLLSYARDEVPKMAIGIGGIQKPQLLIPKGGSFDIGIIKETDKREIPLAQVKPVFVRATLFEETRKRDILKLSQVINEKLNEASSKGDAKSSFVFIDADDYPGANSISGSYAINGDKINFTGTLVCGSKEKSIRFENVSSNELVEKLVALATAVQ